jgi:hypothetical protein
MTVTSSIVCGRTHPYIMSPKTSPKPCWRRIAFPDSGEVVTGLGGCERIRASPRWPKKIRVRGRRNRNSHWRRHAELAELSTACSPREPVSAQLCLTGRAIRSRSPTGPWPVCVTLRRAAGAARRQRRLDAVLRLPLGTADPTTNRAMCGWPRWPRRTTAPRTTRAASHRMLTTLAAIAQRH